MEKKFLQQLIPLPNIPQKELDGLIKLEDSPDPLARLNSRYYPTIRQEFYSVFLEAAKGHSVHSIEYQVAKDELDTDLKALRKMYISDLELACELFLTTTQIWSPHKVNISVD